MVEATPTVELFVRSLQPTVGGVRQRRVVERLDRLAADGAIEDYELTVWGRQVAREGPVAETDAAGDLQDLVAAVHDWADDAGVDVESLFEERAVESDLSGDSYAATVLPTMLLAERVDGELRFVAPHDREDGRYAITDRLARLAAGADVSTEHPDGDVSAIAD